MTESHADLQTSDNPKDNASRQHGYLKKACGCRHIELTNSVLHGSDDGHSGDQKDDSANDDASVMRSISTTVVGRHTGGE
jgi:hypothetical protein